MTFALGQHVNEQFLLRVAQHNLYAMRVHQFAGTGYILLRYLIRTARCQRHRIARTAGVAA